MKEKYIAKTLGVLLVAGATVHPYHTASEPARATGLESQPTPVSSPSPHIYLEEAKDFLQERTPTPTLSPTPTLESYIEGQTRVLPALENQKVSEIPAIAGRFILPVSGEIYYGYQFMQEAPRSDGGTYSHAGVDLNLRGEGQESLTGWEDLGALVLNTANGVVVYAGDSESEFGNVIIMEHTILLENGRETKVYSQYSHLDQIEVEKGRVYRIGERIGTVGTTGRNDYTPHLHWEIFGRVHYNYIRDWGFIRTAFDRGYVEATHFDPIIFINFRNSLMRE